MVAAVSLGGCVLGLGCAIGGSAFVDFGIQSDLEDYYAAVASADLPSADQERVLARIDALSDGVQDGTVRISLFAWINHDEQIEACIEDDVITPHELLLIERQLDKLERYAD